ncbi:MAG: sodium/glutamate symporter [Thermodesulfobacteriota bacterium]|nr:sodium/glutamate symporter [Thermodesulfobacteriota bacterium]
MSSYTMEGFASFTLAIILLFLGKLIISRSELLKRYSIPEPVIGGFLCAVLVALSYYFLNFELSFDLRVRDVLLLYFFGAIGLQTDIRTLINGGRPLAILLILATVFIVLQNLVGISVASLFGMDPKAGLLVGSISLVGGVGTALAWSPTFVENFNISNALEIGVAANTVGLISACLIGGPIARYLIIKYKIITPQEESLDIGVVHGNEQSTMIDSYALLWAWLWLNVAIILGYFFDKLLQAVDFQLPMFVSCLMAGILIGNCRNWYMKKDEAYPGAKKGIALISDISLGMFLTMALMGLQIWELQGLVAFISSVMFCQILLSVCFTLFVVFRLMGKDYEATVISAGFGGITLGSTATAIVNMSSVAKQYGAAHRAFIIVPLVCGFFIDFVNALVIRFFVGL